MNKEQFNRAVYLLRKAQNINLSIPKGYGVHSWDYHHWYRQKSQLLELVVQLIKQHALPIKYGYNNGVTYFAVHGAQYSFHGNYGTKKKYNGKWQGTPRKSFVLNKKRIIGKNSLCVD